MRVGWVSSGLIQGEVPPAGEPLEVVRIHIVPSAGRVRRERLPDGQWRIDAGTLPVDRLPGAPPVTTALVIRALVEILREERLQVLTSDHDAPPAAAAMAGVPFVMAFPADRHPGHILRALDPFRGWAAVVVGSEAHLRVLRRLGVDAVEWIAPGARREWLELYRRILT